MKAIIDGDILRYEVGFAAEAAIKAASDGDWLTNGAELPLPDWDWVQNIFFERFNRILDETDSQDYAVYLTEGPSFRHEVATTKPYKGSRVDHKPWHFKNLSAFIKAHFNVVVARPGLEADDEMAIAQTTNTTVVCSRDKDLRQLNGWGYSWELGRQARWGPTLVTTPGEIRLSSNRKKLEGEGHMWFYGQLIVGDTADNIPGVEGFGPVAAYGMLGRHESLPGAWDAVKRTYRDKYKAGWEERLTEQARLLYLVREYPFKLWSMEDEDAMVSNHR